MKEFKVARKASRHALRGPFRWIPTWALVVGLILALPLHLAVEAIPGIVEGFGSWRDEIREVRNMESIATYRDRRRKK